MANEISLDVDADVENHKTPKMICNDFPLEDENEKLFKDLYEEASRERPNPGNAEKPRTKIQRFPDIMLQSKQFKKYYYEPREVSIGPIHADCDKLAKRELKIKLAARFVKRSGTAVENLFALINSEVCTIRKCFDESVIEHYDNYKLIRLLFLDGCFLLQFVESYMSDSLKDFNITNGEAALITTDLLLVQNQIPFLVLMILMHSSNDEFYLMKNVLKFVGMNMPIGNPDFVGHLLDLENPNFFSLFRPRRLFSNEYLSLLYLIKMIDPVHLLDLLRGVQLYDEQTIRENKDKRDPESLVDKFRSSERTSRNKRGCFLPSFWNLSPNTIRSFRNVQELKLAGITPTPSGSWSLKAVSFSTKFFISGQLKLPTLIVDNSTEQKLLNLIAYEMSLPDHENNWTVTSYVSFLDLLIDNEQDVKDLRAACILWNRLSCDAEVVELFNSIGDCCRIAPKDDYLKIKNEIQRHYGRKTSIWMAQVYNDHFKSPWTVIALLAALIVLILTGIQTWYTVQSS